MLRLYRMLLSACVTVARVTYAHLTARPYNNSRFDVVRLSDVINDIPLNVHRHFWSVDETRPVGEHLKTRNANKLTPTTRTRPRVMKSILTERARARARARACASNTVCFPGTFCCVCSLTPACSPLPSSTPTANSPVNCPRLRRVSTAAWRRANAAAVDARTVVGTVNVTGTTIGVTSTSIVIVSNSSSVVPSAVDRPRLRRERPSRKRRPRQLTSESR